MKEYIIKVDESKKDITGGMPLVGEAQELVRCKDCKHGEKPPTFQCYPKLTWCNKYERSHDDDWFCADGERK